MRDANQVPCTFLGMFQVLGSYRSLLAGFAPAQHLCPPSPWRWPRSPPTSSGWTVTHRHQQAGFRQKFPLKVYPCLVTLSLFEPVFIFLYNNLNFWILIVYTGIAARSWLSLTVFIFGHWHQKYSVIYCTYSDFSNNALSCIRKARSATQGNTVRMKHNWDITWSNSG